MSCTVKTNNNLEQQAGFEYFYSLVKPKSERKKRSCLKCQVVFVSRGKGNRVCSICCDSNARHKAIANYTY